KEERELAKTNTLSEDLTDLKRFDRMDGVTDGFERERVRSSERDSEIN
ncbi:hypothetical protein A2U01_0081038, partial [Trifolium medium]|nr:hypothetical protein [Trifolium medium]